MKKYYGKEKCRILKTIRAEIARQNDIEWVVSECSHKGDCRGTCPRCEQEVRQLEAALARREALGKTIAVAGISAGLALTVVGCANPSTTDGMMEAPPSATNAPASEQTTGTKTETETQTDSLAVQTEMGELPIPGEETEPSALETGELIEGEMPETSPDMGAVEEPTTEPPIPGGETEPWLETETEMGDLIDGEMPEMGDVTEWEEDETTEPPIPGEEPETEEILMGDPVIWDEETEEEFLMGAPLPPERFTDDETSDKW